MSDLDMLHADRVRRALVMRDGKVDFEEYMGHVVDVHRVAMGLASQGAERLDIQSS